MTQAEENHVPRAKVILNTIDNVKWQVISRPIVATHFE